MTHTDPTANVCEICGAIRGLDRHHVTPRRMGGTRDPAIHDESNLMTLCRKCHRNLHEGRWELIRSEEGFHVIDPRTGEQVMRRVYNPGVDVPSLFRLLNLTEETLGKLHEALPFFTDEQLVEAFGYATSFGKHAWLVQAAILYEAQKRSTYGERTLEAIALRFAIGLRHAQKYALVWNVFFAKNGREDEEENVNIDAILLDEPSWYIVAVTETKEPEKWVAYAQDRKMEDSRYSVSAFRRDIMIARFTAGVIAAKDEPAADDDEGPSRRWACPWVKLYCTRSGTPHPYRSCTECEFREETPTPTEPALAEA